MDNIVNLLPFLKTQEEIDPILQQQVEDQLFSYCEQLHALRSTREFYLWMMHKNWRVVATNLVLLAIHYQRTNRLTDLYELFWEMTGGMRQNLAYPRVEPNKTMHQTLIGIQAIGPNEYFDGPIGFDPNGDL